MYYSTSSATHAANGSTAAAYGTPTRKSASSGYRLTAAAAVSSSDRYNQAAAAHGGHQAAAGHLSSHQHRTATPNGRASGAAHHHHQHRQSEHGYHSHSHTSSGHHSATTRHPQRYAADKYDRQETSQTVYKAPQLAPASYESSPYHQTTPGRSTQAAPASARRLSASVGASSRSAGSAYRPATQQQVSGGSSLSTSAGQQPSLAGFCTQVAATPASSSSKSSHQHQAHHNPQLEDSWVKKVPQYNEYASVRHPPHYYNDAPLLPYLRSSHKHRHLLVLDLDETLVHASAQQPASYDAAFNVDMETQVIRIYVKHRPHMMEFLRAMSRIFEVCVFTASLSKYANQVLDNIDPHKELITHRLYREHCTEVDGSYTKDMSILGRPTENVVILDNSPVAYMFYPNNAVSCTSWFEDETDTELKTLIPKFEHIAHAPTAMQGLHHRASRRQLL